MNKGYVVEYNQVQRVGIVLWCTAGHQRNIPFDLSACSCSAGVQREILVGSFEHPWGSCGDVPNTERLVLFTVSFLEGVEFVSRIQLASSRVIRP